MRYFIFYFQIEIKISCKSSNLKSFTHTLQMIYFQQNIFQNCSFLMNGISYMNLTKVALTLVSRPWIIIFKEFISAAKSTSGKELLCGALDLVCFGSLVACGGSIGIMMDPFLALQSLHCLQNEQSISMLSRRT